MIEGRYMGLRTHGDATPRVTVFTPCWNSEKTLHRVWESLRVQTFRDFEWIVCDDGSLDGTWAKILGFAQASDVPVRALRFSHSGIPALINHASRVARGEFFVMADSDDAFEPNALKVFLAAWHAIPEAERASFSGVWARCKTEEGELVGSPFEEDPFDATLFEVQYRLKMTAEMWPFTRTELLRAFPQPEIDYYVPGSVVWQRIAEGHKTRFIAQPLRTYFADPGSITNAPRMRYNRGLAYAISVNLNRYIRYQRRDVPHLLRDIINYGRYSRHVGRGFLVSALGLDDPIVRALYLLFYPASVALATRDHLLGRLDRTPYAKGQLLEERDYGSHEAHGRLA